MKSKIFKPSPIIAILMYLVIFVFFSSFITMGIGFIWVMNGQINMKEMLDYFSLSEVSNEVKSIGDKAYTIGNFITYLLLFITITFYLRDKLKEDISKSKNWLFVIWIVVGSIAFYYINDGVGYLADKLTNTTSDNQELIISMIFTNPVLTFMSVGILAPVVEELIYRKAIFEIFKTRPVIAFIVSVLIFALPHMLSTSTTILNWCILFAAYATSGLLLAVSYYFSKKNIYVPIVLHMVSNIVAFIFIYGGF